jgi:hypothetical protein
VRLLVAGWRAALLPRFCRLPVDTAELLIDAEEDPALRAVLVGMLREAERG